MNYEYFCKTELANWMFDSIGWRDCLCLTTAERSSVCGTPALMTFCNHNCRFCLHFAFSHLSENGGVLICVMDSGWERENKRFCADTDRISFLCHESATAARCAWYAFAIYAISLHYLYDIVLPLLCNDALFGHQTECIQASNRGSWHSHDRMFYTIWRGDLYHLMAWHMQNEQCKNADILLRQKGMSPS